MSGAVRTCKHGHLVNDANTDWDYNSHGTPFRRCRTCRLETRKRYDNRRKAARRAAATEKLAARNKAMCDLHTRGLSYTKIANRLGLSRATVLRFFNADAGLRHKQNQERHRAKKRAEFNPDTPLMRRHRAAMEIVRKLHPDERYELLAAVVWPESDVLEQMAVAA